MKKKIGILVAAILIATIVFATSIFAANAGGFKKIDAWFGDIKLMVNGTALQSDTPPFIYNNSTYVPLRLLSQAIGQKVEWNQNTRTVVITGNTAEVANLKAQLSQKDTTIASLQQQLKAKDDQLKAKDAKIAELEDELNNAEDEDEDTDEDAAATLEDYLDEEYSTWKDVDFSFDVSGDADELKLTIDVDLDKDGDAWDEIDNDEIEDLLNDIYDHVQDEYSDADFSGKIVDSDSDDTLVEFEASDDGLDVSF